MSEPPSGLRNPAAAVRGVGAGALALEALVLLLALLPLSRLGAGGVAIGVAAGFAVIAGGLAGLLGRAWAWWAATVLQPLLVAAGLLHWSLAVVGVLFGLVWGYVLYVRRRILG